MPNLEAMTLDEINVMMEQLRTRRKALKTSGATAQRKILTLARRRERLMQQVNALDQQIAQLCGGYQAPAEPLSKQRHSRRSRIDVTDCLEAIVACVQRHGSAQRATIAEECQLSPAKASAVLRQLCQAGTLVRHGEKSQTIYSMP
ncbi:MAG: hypothetical protein ACYDCO_07545 [Armatimonadota bacterium]